MPVPSNEENEMIMNKLYAVTNIGFSGDPEVLSVHDTFLPAALCKRLAGLNADVHGCVLNEIPFGLRGVFTETYRGYASYGTPRNEGVFAVAYKYGDRVSLCGVYTDKILADRVSIAAGFGARVFEMESPNTIPPGLIEYGKNLGILECK